MTRIQQTRLVVTIIIGLLAGATLGYAVNAATNIIHVPAGVYHGSQTLGTADTTPGQTCDFVLTVTNPGRPSIHNDNFAIVSIDGVAIITTPIEREGAPGGGSATATTGSVVTLDLVTDDVSSAGFVVSMDCPPPTTTTTTTAPPPDTTTTAPPPDTTTTTTTVAPSPTTTTTQPPDVPPVIRPTTTTTTEAPPPPATTATTEAPIPSGVPTGSGPPSDPPRRSMTPAFAIIIAGAGIYAIGWGIRKVRAR